MHTLFIAPARVYMLLNRTAQLGWWGRTKHAELDNMCVLLSSVGPMGFGDRQPDAAQHEISDQRYTHTHTHTPHRGQVAARSAAWGTASRHRSSHVTELTVRRQTKLTSGNQSHAHQAWFLRTKMEFNPQLVAKHEHVLTTTTTKQQCPQEYAK